MRGAWLPAVVGLALGLGSNFAVYLVVHATVLHDLPYEDPDKLVMVWQSTRTNATRARGLSTPLLLREWRRHEAFADVAATELWSSNPSSSFDIETTTGIERARGAFVTPNWFTLLGARFARGHGLAEHNGRAVVLSHSYWTNRLGSDPSVLGRSLRVTTGRDRQSSVMTIVGVLDQEFQFTYPDSTDAWALLPWAEIEAAEPAALRYTVVGRLRPGLSASEAQAMVTSTWSTMASTIPNGAFLSRVEAWLEPISEYSVGQFRQLLFLLALVTGALFIGCCLNVTMVSLAQCARRRHDFTIQRALGATDRTITRILVSECGVLAVVSTVIVVSAAAMSQDILRAVTPATIPRSQEIVLDAQALAWVVLIAIATVLVCGAATVLYERLASRSTRVNLSSRGVDTSGQRDALIISGQLAIAEFVVIVAVSLCNNLFQAIAVDRGFDGRDVTGARVRLLDPRFRDAQRLVEFQRELLSDLRGRFPAGQFAAASALPFQGRESRVLLETGGGTEVMAIRRVVDRHFFDVMRLRMVKGRAFGNVDDEGKTRVAVVSRALAVALFGSATTVDQVIELSSFLGGPTRVVGIVENTHFGRLGEPDAPVLYLSADRAPMTPAMQVLWTDRVGGEVAAAYLEATVRRLAPNEPIEAITRVDTLIAASYSDREFLAVAVSLLGGVSLSLTLIGLLGGLRRLVDSKEPELAIRLALGASSRHLLVSVTGRLAVLSAFGLLLGGGLGAFASRLFRSFLPGFRELPPIAYPAVVGILMLVVAAVLYRNARTGLRVASLRTLR